MPGFVKTRLVCYTAVFSVVTQRWGGALRDDTKNGCVTRKRTSSTGRYGAPPQERPGQFYFLRPL